MSRPLHPDAGIRCLRERLEWLDEAKKKLAEAMSDPKVPLRAYDVLERQLAQCEVEIEEIEECQRMLTLLWDGKIRAQKLGHTLNAAQQELALT